MIGESIGFGVAELEYPLRICMELKISSDYDRDWTVLHQQLFQFFITYILIVFYFAQFPRSFYLILITADPRISLLAVCVLVFLLQRNSFLHFPHCVMWPSSHTAASRSAL